MEAEKRKIELEKKDIDIVYSKAIKAGKRIYYLDVKKSRNDDLFLAITESKKKIVGNGSEDDAQVTYEKHKIFLYREDFDKFLEGVNDVIGFIKREQGDVPQREYTDYKKDELTSGSEKTQVDEPKKSFFDKFKF